MLGGARCRPRGPPIGVAGGPLQQGKPVDSCPVVAHPKVSGDQFPLPNSIGLVTWCTPGCPSKTGLGLSKTDLAAHETQAILGCWEDPVFIFALSTRTPSQVFCNYGMSRRARLRNVRLSSVQPDPEPAEDEATAPWQCCLVWHFKPVLRRTGPGFHTGQGLTACGRLEHCRSLIETQTDDNREVPKLTGSFCLEHYD